MHAALNGPSSVEKEFVSELHFQREDDVLHTPAERKERFSKLIRAMLLGNNFKRKVSIVFRCREGLKRVETTVWAATDRNIMLKGGIHIPVNCILDVST